MATNSAHVLFAQRKLAHAAAARQVVTALAVQPSHVHDARARDQRMRRRREELAVRRRHVAGALRPEERHYGCDLAGGPPSREVSDPI